MRVVIQRVSHASVSIDGKIKSEIRFGILLLLGVEDADEINDVEWLCKKISMLRIFNDANGLMNLSIAEAGGDVLVISQFTLFASTKKGNRPSFVRAARPEKAIHLYEQFISTLEAELQKKIFTGEFGALMKVELINEGPVTILMDSKNRD